MNKKEILDVLKLIRQKQINTDYTKGKILSSLLQDNKWAIGTSIGSEDIQQFVSIGVEQIAINSSLEGMLKNNHTYYVSIRCENGAELVTQWNDEIGQTLIKNY